MEAGVTADVSGRSRTLTLRDGRAVGLAEYGSRGSPVLYFPGLGDSRLSVPPEGADGTSGARVIAIDAPGVGLSDPAPFRSFAARAEDTEQVADLLGLDRFAVFGWSAGGPHALAAARRLSDRVSMVGLACAFAPFERAEVRALSTRQMRQGASMMARLPFMATLLTRRLPKLYQRGPRQAFLKQFGPGLSTSDRALLNTAAGDALLRGAAEAVRRGSTGQAQEMKLLLAYPWGFRPEDVEVPVFLWYGDEDRIVTPSTANYLHSVLRQSTLTIYPGEGHMLPFSHWDEFMRVLGDRD